MTRPASSPPFPAGLTRDDLDLLALLADGLGVAAIARQRSLSPRACRDEVDDVVRRLGARNEIHAVVIALRAGRL